MEKLYYEFKDAYTKALSGTDVNTPWQRRKDAALAIAAQQVCTDAPVLLKTYGSFIGGKRPFSEFSDDAKTGMQISLAMAQGVRKYNSTLNGHSNGHVKQETAAPKVKRTRKSSIRADSGLTMFFALCAKFTRFPDDAWVAGQIGVKPDSLTSYRSQAKKRGYTFAKTECGWDVALVQVHQPAEKITPSDMEALKEIVAKFGLKIS